MRKHEIVCDFTLDFVFVFFLFVSRHHFAIFVSGILYLYLRVSHCCDLLLQLGNAYTQLLPLLLGKLQFGAVIGKL